MSELEPPASSEDVTQRAQLNALIEESYDRPDSGSIQDQANQSALAYLIQYYTVHNSMGTEPENSYKGPHWLCDKDKPLANIVTRALFIFALPSSEVTATFLKNLEFRLGTCFHCAQAYHVKKEELRGIMLNRMGYDIEILDGFFGCITNWDLQRVLRALSPSVEIVESTGVLGKKDLSLTCMNAIFECLCSSTLLYNEELLKSFFSVFFALQRGGKFLRLASTLIPGMITLLFSSDKRAHRWAKKSFDILKDNKELKDTITFDNICVRAFEPIFKSACANQFNPAKSVTFWGNMAIFLDALPKESIKARLCGGQMDIIQFICMQALSFQPESLPVILRALNTLLAKLGSSFWSYAAPHTCQNFVQAIFASPKYQALLETIPLSYTKEEIRNFETDLTTNVQSLCTVDDLLIWIESFIKELAPSFQLKMGPIVVSSLFGMVEKNFGLRSESKERIISLAFDILARSFETSALSAASGNSNVGADVERLMKKEAREIAERYHEFICKTILDGISAKTKEKALVIIKLCLKFDVDTLFNSNTLLLKNPESDKAPVAFTPEDPVNEAVDQILRLSPTFYPGFWNTLEKTVAFNSDISLRSVIISSVANASFVEKIKVTPGSKQETVRTAFNKVLDSYITSITNMLTSIGQSTSIDLKGLLDEPETLISLMTMLFSHNQSIYDANISIITETFDTDGRIESLRALFEYKLKESLSAYNYALKAANQAGNFGPCPKLIRVSMDVVHIFFNPRNGIYSTNSIDVKSSLEELSVFWDNSWNVLTWLYAKTLTWANFYEKDIMLEYMRDVLEYNGHLIKEFRLVEQLLAATVPGANSQVIAPTENSAISKELLLIVVGALQTMKSWLRLYDMSLLQFCVDNICSILELVHQFKAPFPIPLLRFFVRISVKAKDGNRTKLTKEQRSRLLISLTTVNEEGVNNILEAIQKESEPSPQPQPQPLQRGISPQSVNSSGTSAVKKATLDSWVRKDNSTLNAFESEANRIKRMQIQQAAQNNIRRGQSQITSFATPGSRIQFPNTIQDDEDTKSSLITSMRSELVKARQKKAGLISTGPSMVIHAARPAGFNNKGRLDTKAKSKSKDVSSDSESESESDDEEGLFSSKKKLSKLRAIEKPTVVSLDFAPKSKVSKISPKELAERNMRARLHIDLNPLYRQILSWNYHSESDFPTENKNYTDVATKFSSPVEYQKSFEPLLMLECWQSIKKAKEESIDKPWKIIIGSRTTVDDFFDIYASVESKVIRDNKLSDSDVVVLSYYPTSAGDVDPKMPSPGQACCLAKIKEIKSANSEYSDVILRTYKPMDMMAHLVPRTELHGLRVSGLTPIEREYCSLKGLPYYDLFEEITRAKPTKLSIPSEGELQDFISRFGVNKSQATAILGSISTKGFSLIQGPPGTGKTKTILGIVGSFLTSPQALANSIEAAGNSSTLKKDELPRRILICAPSNAAVDELVIRLKAGIKDHNGQHFSPNIVRLGRSDAINPNVRDLTLEELVEREAAKTETDKDMTPDVKLREEHSKVLAQRNTIREKLSSGKDLSQDDISGLQAELHALIRKKNELGRKLDDQRERITMSYRRKDIARRNIQAGIINGAQVICATLSGSSSDVLASLQLTFDTVVIDEACQCIELSALIPLKYGCTRCIMVGDPNQLPPTVLSLAAAKCQYEQSLFVRMQKNYPESVHMLDVQYRMHPSISKFPSDEFYDSKLIDGPNMDLKTKQPWHENSLFQPYRFFNVHSTEEVNKRTHSIFNKTECEIAMELYMALIAYMGEDFTGTIGVISPYKQQVFMLKNMFRARFGENIFREIDFNTIDGFQGQEKDIIILSCVRSGQSTGVGFLNDIRRMNVAITRAKSSLWILGNEPTLLKSRVWERLIIDAKNRDSFYSLKKGFKNNSSFIKPLVVSGKTKGALPVIYPTPSVPRSSEDPRRRNQSFNLAANEKIQDIKDPNFKEGNGSVSEYTASEIKEANSGSKRKTGDESFKPKQKVKKPKIKDSLTNENSDSFRTPGSRDDIHKKKSSFLSKVKKNANPKLGSKHTSGPLPSSTGFVPSENVPMTNTMPVSMNHPASTGDISVGVSSSEVVSQPPSSGTYSDVQVKSHTFGSSGGVPSGPHAALDDAYEPSGASTSAVSTYSRGFEENRDNNDSNRLPYEGNDYSGGNSNYSNYYSGRRFDDRGYNDRTGYKTKNPNSVHHPHRDRQYSENNSSSKNYNDRGYDNRSYESMSYENNNYAHNKRRNDGYKDRGYRESDYNGGQANSSNYHARHNEGRYDNSSDNKGLVYNPSSRSNSYPDQNNDQVRTSLPIQPSRSGHLDGSQVDKRPDHSGKSIQPNRSGQLGTLNPRPVKKKKGDVFIRPRKGPGFKRT